MPKRDNALIKNIFETALCIRILENLALRNSKL